MMNDKLEALTEAMAGVLSEQRALQAYAVDFVNAYNQEDWKTMVKAFKRAVVLYGVFIKEFKDKPGIATLLKCIDDMSALIEKIESADVQNKRKRS